MRIPLGLLILISASLVAAGIVAAVDGPPPWAYGFAGPAAPAGNAPAPAAAGRGVAPAAAAAPEDGTLLHLAGSTLAFTRTQVRDGFGPADWFPGDHPPMPEIVAKGRAPEIRACSLCHYPNGKGRPENSGVIGLPYAYFVETMMDFKNGNRKTADSRKANTANMAAFAKAMTDSEIAASAAYFTSMKWTPWIRVVETNTVPKTRIANGMFLKLPGNETEPIGQRIIEAAENADNTEQLRDPHSGFVAYVPVGSIKRGEALVVNGGAGKTTACGVCHGANLEGLGPVPGLAGRSPSYLVRQMYDMQQGTRTGTWTTLMKPVVAKLSNEDMLAIAAYTASRPVGPATPQELRSSGK